MLRYGFVWRREFEAGHEEGRKDRPCTVVLSARTADGETRVYVLPVTHTPPVDPALAMEIPSAVKQHLQLDGERSWIVLDEINDFLWPGFDLRPVPGARPARSAYGMLPPRFFEEVRRALVALAAQRRVKRVPRT